MKETKKEIITNMENEEIKRQEEKNEKEIRKKYLKKIIINAIKPLIVILLVVCIIATIIASLLHYIHLYDGTKQEGDLSNLPYLADYSLANAKITPGGNITTALSAQEIWDTIIENNGRIDKYLDSPEELKKLLNAELITKYVDTRENPDEPIDWDKINNDPNSKIVPGIVKLKRKSSDNGEKATMTYVDPETFQANIDKYNETGKEEDKLEALNHFTLGIETKPTNITDPESGTDGTAKKIERGATILIPEGQGLGESYSYSDWQSITLESSFEYKLKEKAGVTFDEEGFGRINGRYVVATTSTFGTIGDYIDYYLEDGTIIQCIIGKIKNSTQTDVNSWGSENGKTILEFIVNRETWMTPLHIAGGKADKMHVNPGTNGFHMEWNQRPIKVTNGGNYFENPNFVDGKTSKKKKGEGTKVASNDSVTIKDINLFAKLDENQNKKNKEDIEFCYPSAEHWGIEGNRWGTISSPFGDRDINDEVTNASKDHKGVDLVPGKNLEVFAAADGVIHLTHTKYGGNVIEIDHGNGYITRYAHNAGFNVEEGQVVKAGDLIAKAGSSGEGIDHVHIHFEILQWDSKKGEYVAQNPADFKYYSKVGFVPDELKDGTRTMEDAKTSGLEGLKEIISTGTPKYYAKVASWSVKNETIITDDPDFNLGEGYKQSQDGKDKKFESTELLMGSSYLDYQNLVGQYDMPLEYLLGFLFVGQGKEFVDELAGLVYNSEIDIAILDNLTVDTLTITDTYTKQIDVETDTIAHVEYVTFPKKKGESSISGSADESEEDLKATIEEPHTITRIVEVKTNTINAGVAKANTWLSNASRGTVPEVKEPIRAEAEGDMAEIKKKEVPDKTDDQDYANLAEDFRKQVENNYAGLYDSASAWTTYVNTDYYFSYKDIKRKVNNQIEIKNHIMTPAEILEKTDPNSTEPNFVTIFQDAENRQTATNIHSAEGWLLEMYEKNSTTAEMVDLTKYLLNKAEGETDNKEGLDLGILDPDNFMPTISGGRPLTPQGPSDLHLIAPAGSFHYYANDGRLTRETWCDLPPQNLAKIMKEQYGYDDYELWIRDDGVYMFGDYVVVAADIPHMDGSEQEAEYRKGNLVQTSLGTGIVMDYCEMAEKTRKDKLTGEDKAIDVWYDIYTAWHDGGKYQSQAYSGKWDSSPNRKGTLKNPSKLNSSSGNLGNSGKPGNSSSTGNSGSSSKPGNSSSSGNSGSSSKPGGSSNSGNSGSSSRPGGSNSSENSSNDTMTKTERLLEAADKIHMQQTDWKYGTNKLIKNDIEKSIVNPAKVTCGATYVSHVLYASKTFSVEQMNSFDYNSAKNVHEFLREEAKWKQINNYNDLEAGDIVFINLNNGGDEEDHVKIYAGDETWYSAGGDSSIKGSTPYKDTKSRKNFYVAYRLQ